MAFFCLNRKNVVILHPLLRDNSIIQTYLKYFQKNGNEN
jgi:hypothetical protein